MSDLDLFLTMEEGRPVPKAPRVAEVRTRVALPPSRLPGLDYALNPYVGCQHDCLYCYAPYVTKRPRSEWTKVQARTDLPQALAKEIEGKERDDRPGNGHRPLSGGGKAPADHQALSDGDHSKRSEGLGVLTKSDLILRDMDLYKELQGEVGITVTSVSDALSRELEPGAPLPGKRLAALGKLAEAGINAYALIGPLLPVIEEKDAAELVDALEGTGIKWVMIDRFRPRPGMFQDIRSAGRDGDDGGTIGEGPIS